MALTGRFNLRKTLTGRIVLQVEEEVTGFWSRMFGKTKLHRRWRDANVLDLAAPELRSLVDLRFRHGVRRVEAVPVDDVAEAFLPALVRRLGRDAEQHDVDHGKVLRMPSSGFSAFCAPSWPIAVTHHVW